MTSHGGKVAVERVPDRRAADEVLTDERAEKRGRHTVGSHIDALTYLLETFQVLRPRLLDVPVEQEREALGQRLAVCLARFILVFASQRPQSHRSGGSGHPRS